MSIKRWSVALFPLILIALASTALFAQSYSNKPLHAVVSGLAGGGGDFAMRTLAPELSKNLQEQIIVDNRPTLIGGGMVAKATADGHTVFVTGNSLWLGSLLGQKAPYTIKDFAPVTINSRQALFVVVPSSSPVKSVKELIDLAKSKPGELNYGSLGVGSATHLGAELFKAMTGTKIVGISYSGAGEALTDLLSGRVQVMFQNAASVMSQVKAGKLRALAVTTSKASALMPDLPTVAASGVPGYESSSVLAVVAPAKTPASIINHLNREFARALSVPEVKQKYLETGVEAVGSSPEELAATIKSDIVKWGKLIKDLGIKLD